jgi:cyclic beta-1,2-glucan synthetase
MVARGEHEGPTVPSWGALSDPFVVRLMQLLRDQEGATATLERLDADLAAEGSDPNEVLRREHHRQAASQVTVGNCVLSLRLLSALDWNAFFEHASHVEVILRNDPAGIYSNQDFATCDRYRRTIETIARNCNADEIAVAQRAVELAMRSRDSGLGRPRDHVGFYLVDRGQPDLKAALGYRTGWREHFADWVQSHASLTYFGSITFVLGTLVVTAALTGLGPLTISWWLPLVGGALLLPLSELAVGLVNQLLTLLLPPRVLPKLDLKGHVPAEYATFVVIPSMLSRISSPGILAERLETHYLANPDPGLRFGLLTDFSDAPSETMPQDAELLRDALARVQALNERYANGGPDRFFLFHRRRLWNASEGCWMGWERKRGKLLEFNRLLCGRSDTSYAVCSADPSSLPQTHFVITLDVDTQMLRDTAGRLIGTMAHPLNRPVFDRSSGCVIAGYGVLQPRISFHLAAAVRSRFASLLATSGGIDPYSTAASDAYMDLFGIGTFTGKGIYDVEAFEAATGETFPENRILSHDLIEGNFARCGLLSDTELFDDFPARYHAYARREHRWVRGDWQLVPWLGRRIPIPASNERFPPISRGSVTSTREPRGDSEELGGTSASARRIGRSPRWRVNPLPVLARWKLLDNLRRSLVPPAQLILLVLGWTVLPGSPWLWTVIALATFMLPVLQMLMSIAIGGIRARSLVPLRKSRDRIPAVIGQILVEVVFLAYRSVLLVDAVVRTLVRLFITRRKLLEWETAATTEQRLGAGLSQFVAGMWAAPALSLAIAGMIAALRPGGMAVAVPFLVAWIASPCVAFYVSRPRVVVQRPLSEQERWALRRIARKTWAFFETFVGDDDHWLPPDNFQEIPDGRIAHRTSPTNQGLLLLSTLAASDLGYISPSVLVDRLERTFETLNRLEKHWGHFYNWYDTRTLQPLPPPYISTVDSGNLLGSLITLAHGLRQKAESPLLGPAVALGLADTLGLAAEEQGAESCQALWTLIDSPPQGNVAVAPRADTEGSDRGVAGGTPRDEVDEWTTWLAALERAAINLAGHDRSDGATSGDKLVRSSSWADRLLVQVRAWRVEFAALRESDATDLVRRLQCLAQAAEALAGAMDFRALYRSERHLFAIGFNVVQGRLDSACYDLLASESCLTSYLAVARGEAPRQHWFQLGRPYIRAAGGIGLISWGGTMFEYLMPRLLLRGLPGTLLAEACRTAVARQIEYGHHLALPWGISESAFSAQFLDGDYKYQAFGTPGLGLKQGLEQDVVVAPYATAMATMIAPRDALANFRRLAEEGAEGVFGFYESIDYTPDRLPKGQRCVIVKTYMAHHQGMSLVGLTNALFADVMTHRFRAEPMVRAVDLLLQEQISREVPIVDAVDPSTRSRLAPPPASAESGAAPMSRRLTTPATPAPRTLLLSNTQYHVMLTNSGSGTSTCRGLDVSRWREDAACESWGQFCYVRDLQRGVVWSAGFQPVCRAPESYEVIFASDKATFRRRDLNIEAVLEVIVSPEHRAEIRRVTLVNHDSSPRELDLTSYVEVLLAPRGSDLSHTAFGKLFLETEWVPGPGALLCRRRMRSAAEAPLWAVHVVAVDRSARGSSTVGETQYETDRARFLGRARTVANPAALEPGSILSGTVGPVLDPVLSLRRRFSIEPGGSAVLAFTTAFAESRAEALALADQFREAGAASRAFELAWAHSQVEHRHHDRTGEDARLFQRLASYVLFAGGTLRAEPTVLARNRLGQTDLWRFGISGDRPIVLARIAAADEIPLARQLLAAHEYLRLRGLEFDLVLLAEEPASYQDELNRQLLEQARTAGSLERIDQPGGVFVRNASQMTEDEKCLLEAAARVVLVGERGSLASQLDRTERYAPMPGRMTASHELGAWVDEPVRLPPNLLFFNGTGGFAPDGREYCALVGGPAPPEISRNGPLADIQAVRHPQFPPAPWANVVANPDFGFLVSEAGSGFTWAGNSQSSRLTPWSNDPVSDPPGEAVFLRDEETGEIWSPTPLPVFSLQPTLVRHGQGYSVFERNAYGLSHELTLLVPINDPIKLIRLRVRSRSNRLRHLSATYYAEWVLGQCRDVAAMHVVTEVDPETGALLARNSFRMDFASRVAFADVDRRPRTLTADRVAFLGRHGSIAAPAGLSRRELPHRVGPALDPCAALQVVFDLQPDATIEIVFLLGEAADVDSARRLVRRYREPGQASRVLQDVRSHWDDLLGAVQVRTPDPALDLLANRWLLYQVLGCRLWARSGFYQSGGAYGFRDQLQDVMALVHAQPAATRAHLLRAAGRQFLEGDVQHWWHPPTGRGIRTRIADDPLWLPYVTSCYIAATGDTSVLDEPIPYLQAPLLRPDQEDDYGLPAVAAEGGSLYDHCLRAFEHVSRVGVHGLPLMQTGDWNDGMNRVGNQGKGESVWLAWFEIACINSFTELVDRRGDANHSAALRQRADALRSAVEAHGWDANWYRRAFFDDGSPLGSAKNAACRIDSIAQSWAVLSGAADRVRARQAMEAVNEHLVNREGQIIALFTPPFDDGPLDPGYIKGYLPGIRENGGQYTHAAIWIVQAFAALQQRRRAFDLLEILNPVRHAQDAKGVERYKVEPYVVAGDVYSRPPHVGRGGWTWYTGSASWFYRTIIEVILGLQRRGDRLIVDPRIPPEWPGSEIVYRFQSSTYQITVQNPHGLDSGAVIVWLDERRLCKPIIPLQDDGLCHQVRVVIVPECSEAQETTTAGIGPSE